MNKRIVFGTLAAVALLLAAMPLSAGGKKDRTSSGTSGSELSPEEERQVQQYQKLVQDARKRGLSEEAIEKSLEERGLSQAQRKAAMAQPQQQALPKITEPLTEANFAYRQNQQGFITIIRYLNEKESGIRDLVIPAQIQGINVTEIAENAFAKGSPPRRWTTERPPQPIDEYHLSDRGEVFESVTIPPTVTSIGAQAFINRGIKTLNLPDSVRSIGGYAFAKNQISSVTLTNVTSIGEFAFMENQLSSITWPTNITSIPRMAFAKNQLASINIPSSVTGIGVGAFGGNRLTELTIPENVTSIGSCAFAANSISKLTFSNSGKLTSIGIAAFSGNRLKSVVLPEGLTSIGSGTSVEFRSIFEGQGEYMNLERYFSVSASDGMLGGNPLGYIKLPSTLGRGEGNWNYRPIARNAAIPAVEWLQPNTSMFDDIGRTEAFKIGDNISTEVSSRLGEGFTNFYASQGKKAGIYMRRGQLWAIATQEEFDAFIAEKTK